MSAADFQNLKLESVIGFDGASFSTAPISKKLISGVILTGAVPQGLLKHPNGVHSIYSLGSTLVVNDASKEHGQEFLQGHTNTISCLAVSKDGQFLASGQVTHMGFQVIIRAVDWSRSKDLNT